MSFKSKVLLSVLLIFSLSACASLKGVNLENSPHSQKLGLNTNDPFRMIAIDLVGALMQAKEVKPSEMEIYLPISDSRLSLAIEDVLVESGVAILRVQRKYGENVLLHSISQTKPNNDEFAVKLVLDRIGLKRNYILTSDYVEPISSLYVRGVSVSTVKLQDEIFLN